MDIYLAGMTSSLHRVDITPAWRRSEDAFYAATGRDWYGLDRALQLLARLGRFIIHTRAPAPHGRPAQTA